MTNTPPESTNPCSAAVPAAEDAGRPPLLQPGHARLAWVLAALLCTFGLTYFVPPLSSFRPWTPEDPVPFAALWDWTPQESPLLFEQQRQTWLDGVPDDEEGLGLSDKALIARAPLPPAIPARPRPAEPPSIVLPPPKPVESSLPSVSAPPTRPWESGQPPKTKAPSPLEKLRLPASAFEGMTRRVELVGGQKSLDHFHAALERVARKKKGAKARIVVYSTSTNGTDRMTQQLRRLFSEHFGDGGKGFVPIAPAWKWQKHQDVRWRPSRDWKTYDVTHDNRRDGRYGFAGVAVMGYRGATTHIGTVTKGPVGRSASRLDLYYQARPRAGRVGIAVDKTKAKVVDTGAESVRDRVYSATFDEGAHDITIRVVGGGPVVLYGAALESSRPGVVVDAAMLIGAFVERLTNFDDEHIARQVALRKPDLLVFYLGANDAAAQSVAWRPRRFRRLYVEAIRKIRKGRPGASCLVMSVLDQGIRRRGRIQTRPRVPKVVMAQKAVAKETGCAFFNLFEAIGGKGTMGKWYKAKPRLVTSDFGHPTVAGARLVGLLFGKALLKSYDGWLAARSNP